MSDDVTSQKLKREGYELHAEFVAALPMPVWVLDLEVERQRTVSAAEIAVLQLLQSDLTKVPECSRAIGMGEDHRLVERTLVKLLSASAVATLGEGFAVTPKGERWLHEHSASMREIVTVELRLDPVRDIFEWVDYERPVYATPETWTIELTPVDDEVLRRRKAEVSSLLTREGLPDDQDKAPGERRGAVNLHAMAIRSRRTHWRKVSVDLMRHSQRREPRLIGYIGEAENPPLTQLLVGHALVEQRRRLVCRST